VKNVKQLLMVNYQGKGKLWVVIVVRCVYWVMGFGHGFRVDRVNWDFLAEDP